VVRGVTAAQLPSRPGAPVADGSDSGSGGGESATQDQPWSWHASRAAALLLVILVPVHFAATFLLADVGATTAREMSDRLADPIWRFLTWLIVALALVHATLSTATALRRRAATVGTTLLTVAVGVLAGGLLATASWALFSRWV